MQTIAINNQHTLNTTLVQHTSLAAWFQNLVAAAEKNRFGVVATLILLQVSLAGFNIILPPMIGASVYLMAPGIVMTFLANSIALAQADMKWVLTFFALSMIINCSIGVYCFTQM